MTCMSHAAHIDLRFSDYACELLGFGVSAQPGNFARERFDLL